MTKEQLKVALLDWDSANTGLPHSEAEEKAVDMIIDKLDELGVLRLSSDDEPVCGAV